MKRVVLTCILTAIGFSVTAQVSPNALVNGSFDDPADPLRTWTYDYEWTKNSHYVGNKDKVSVKSIEGGHNTVAYLKSSSDAGTKMESILLPFEMGYKYTCKLDVKGGPYRLYYAGYKWEPGIRPHDKPTPQEMRLIYKSKVAKSPAHSDWKNVTFELPGMKVSPMAAKNLNHVRYFTVYIWMMRDGYIDNVSVTREKAPELYP